MLIGLFFQPRERRLRFVGWAGLMIISIYLLYTLLLYRRDA
jgi:hypothetical protein